MAVIETLAEYEIERGKPVPSLNHGVVQMILGSELIRHYNDQYTIVSELSLELGDQPATPDISVYPKLPINWRADKTKMTEPPLLVIEILSPTQGMQDLIDKIKRYFEAGVKSCWLVQPIMETISVFAPDMKPHVFSSGEVDDRVVGITLSLENIFSQNS